MISGSAFWFLNTRTSSFKSGFFRSTLAPFIFPLLKSADVVSQPVKACKNSMLSAAVLSMILFVEYNVDSQASNLNQLHAENHWL